MVLFVIVAVIAAAIFLGIGLAVFGKKGFRIMHEDDDDKKKNSGETQPDTVTISIENADKNGSKDQTNEVKSKEQTPLASYTPSGRDRSSFLPYGDDDDVERRQSDDGGSLARQRMAPDMMGMSADITGLDSTNTHEDGGLMGPGAFSKLSMSRLIDQPGHEHSEPVEAVIPSKHMNITMAGSLSVNQTSAVATKSDKKDKKASKSGKHNESSSSDDEEPETLAQVERQEAKYGRSIRSQQKRGYKRIHRAWERVKAPFGLVGSLGLKVQSPVGKDCSCIVTRVTEGSAASKALENGFEVGDLIISVTTASGCWPVYRREHFMAAVGPRGHTFEGSEIIITVVRSQKFCEDWKNAIINACKRSDFPILRAPDGNPMPKGAKISDFPIPDPERVIPVKIKMGPMSQQTRDLRMRRLKSLQKLFPGKLDVEYLFAIQSDPKKCRESIHSLFLDFDTNDSGTIEMDELMLLHKSLFDRAGLPHPPPEVVEAAFHEADIDGDGVLDFEEFYPYLRELLLETLYAAEERNAKK